MMVMTLIYQDNWDTIQQIFHIPSISNDDWKAARDLNGSAFPNHGVGAIPVNARYHIIESIGYKIERQSLFTNERLTVFLIYRQMPSVGFFYDSIIMRWRINLEDE